jgi:mono/diheme cytochrome c family protein
MLGLAVLCAAAWGATGWEKRVPPAFHARKNPLASDKAAGPAGDRLFSKYCAACHGDSGRGNQKIPAITSAASKRFTDGDLFWVITNGVPGTLMTPWNSLTETQRWQLVRYIRTLK